MKKIIFILYLFCSLSVFSQLQVNFPTQLTPAQLVQNVLLGSNVTATNITFNGSAANATVLRDQAGSFSTNFSPTNLGLSSGVLLTTGKSSVALGPNNSSDAAAQTTDGPISNGDPDLAILSGRPVGEINNCSVLEFDFVATGETLNFDFIFASEEYPEWVNPPFNDSFGFFLSGPGITGTFSNGAKNIALVPTTTIPVSISTINNGDDNNGTCTNCAYYYNNSNIGVNPTTWTGQTTQYDGFTTVLTATSSLQCGQTYHIKLAIANVGGGNDNRYDSAVFLKAGSFNVIPLNLGTDLINGSGTAVCDGGNVTLNTGLPITYTFVWKKDGVIIAGQTGPSLLVIAPGTYEVSATTPSGCPLTPDTIVVEFKPPIAVGLPQNLPVCDTAAALESFDLTINTPLVLAALTPASDYEVTYHTSQPDADNNSNPIPVAQLSAYPSAGQTIYVRVTDFEQCFKVQPFTLSLIASPSGTISYSGSPYCSDITTSQPVTSTVPTGGTYSATPAGLNINPTTGAINPSLSTTGITYTVTYSLPALGSCPVFSTTASVVVNPTPTAPTFTAPTPYCQNATATALTATGTSLLWYTTLTGGTGSATAPTPSTTTAGTTNYYVSQTVSGCESPRSTIAVTINPTPLAPTFTPLTPYCQNATATALTATGTSLLWYTTLTGGTGSATAPTPNTTTVGTTDYYVSQTVLGCESPRASIAVVVNAIPAAPTVTPSVPYCQNATATVLTATGTNLLWYTTATGGIGTATAPTPSTTTVATTNYYVSQTVLGCESPRASIAVVVNPTPSAPTFTPQVPYCQNATATVLTATGTSLLWYTTVTGGTGSATAPTPSTATAGTTNYYVSQTVSGCESPRATISVVVNAIPEVILTDGYVCVDQNNVVLNTYPLNTQLLSSEYSFQWYTIVGTTQTPIAASDGGTASVYIASTPGNYGVIVSSTTSIPSCPSQIAIAQVGKSSPPLSFVATPSNYFADLQTVTVSNVIPAAGIYEYQIDNGGYQTSSIFNNIGSGQHVIDVRDANQCGVVSNTVTIIDYPKYFTPNGDGYHDTWNISALNNQPNAKIYIFDRFGKLIKEITPSTSGWDGTFNGQPLPSTDYWFTLFYEENKANKELKSHFALKR